MTNRPRFLVPRGERSGSARTLSRQEIEAIYGTQAPVVRRAPKNLSQSAVKRCRSTWAVVRFNDDGRLSVERSGLGSLDAEAQAGYARDHMSERDVASGWNYGASQSNRQGEFGLPLTATIRPLDFTR